MGPCLKKKEEGKGREELGGEGRREEESKNEMWLSMLILPAMEKWR